MDVAYVEWGVGKVEFEIRQSLVLHLKVGAAQEFHSQGLYPSLRVPAGASLVEHVEVLRDKQRVYAAPPRFLLTAFPAYLYFFVPVPWCLV